jgi:hypothetical protein
MASFIYCIYVVYNKHSFTVAVFLYHNWWYYISCPEIGSAVHNVSMSVYLLFKLLNKITDFHKIWYCDMMPENWNSGAGARHSLLRNGSEIMLPLQWIASLPM